MVMLSSFLVLLQAGSAVKNGLPTNPILWADVPDVSMVRVGDTYYMSSTTMHLSPGLPIMKSKDLVNWQLASYAYERLEENDALNLQNGKNCYGAGTWASSIRYHKGQFIVSTFSQTTGKTHIFITKDPNKTPWKAISFSPSFHDHSLFFEDDGRVFLVYGAGDIRLIELELDLSGVKKDAKSMVIIKDPYKVAGGELGLNAEGSQVVKKDGKYYIFNITWPRGDMRTELVHRADRLEGPYEGRVVMKDRGVAQGSIIEAPDGRWFGYLFRDFGGVGRIPYWVPVEWKDGWPVFGKDLKIPDEFGLPVVQNRKKQHQGIVSSDDFKGSLKMAWQWNHQPLDSHWSLTEKPGSLRLKTSRVDTELTQARNTLTQRTIGPTSTAITKLDASGLKEGDFAGLCLLQRRYGWVGVTRQNGELKVCSANRTNTNLEMTDMLAIPNNSTIWLRVDANFENRADLGTFFYSLDGKNWSQFATELKMPYDIPHFMGYRFGLFNFATKSTGGHADFEFFKIGISPQELF